MLVDNDTFLYELDRMYSKSRGKGMGTVLITAKRQKHFGKAKANAQPEVLYRATLTIDKKQKKKISTTVGPKQMNKFQDSYSEVLRSNVDNLKKKERRKKAKVATSD
mmetsp:Transcript_146/g.378  ORF Transcript_146/g.378 Transcript_146/m.378 type:complete len:107 (+) Transcript_146:42-362(+)|eukprot:CAMPEP_0182924992 /NCGR_PEP_ID=MMETSP0105_2-20130417/8071_1 /TAXON_ID=81532 ORGANISM="Acanthoeca-like sp., Strain 10tr" /NCGR_SAMPLE_ID=MMETSP0105_2 /ASSEMBLY_ACC=CAM_ASM_000205 /LENGTH=106 /DNA_ID=CAMNT_0025062821 /DNA_START=40 /DNA_END=360 /DNA_ORIENTATION=+